MSNKLSGVDLARMSVFLGDLRDIDRVDEGTNDETFETDYTINQLA